MWYQNIMQGYTPQFKIDINQEVIECTRQHKSNPSSIPDMAIFPLHAVLSLFSKFALLSKEIKVDENTNN